MKKLLLINKALMILVFLLIFFAVADFLYVLLNHYTSTPAFTGTASDIIIAATNSALVCIAIFAYRKFFKERIYEKAVNKIDDLLINLDMAISEIEGVYIELVTINAYYPSGNFNSDTFKKYLDDYKDKTQKGLAYSYLASSNSSTLNRWRVEYKTEYRNDLTFLISECFELYMMQTSIYISLTDCISEASGNKKIMPDLDFIALFSQFKERRSVLLASHDKLKNIPADEIFSLY